MVMIVPEFHPYQENRRSLSRDQKVILGFDATTKEPVCLPFDFFFEALVHIRGIPGSGKTSRLLLALVLQVLNLAPEEPVLILDLGGDQALFHAVRAAAKSAGRTFRFLSLDPVDNSDFFDIFQAAQHGGDLLSLVTLLIRALNADYGNTYGGEYFTGQNTLALLWVARVLVERYHAGFPLTVEDVCSQLDSLKTVRDASQIRATFEFLNQLPQLKPHLAPSDDRVIDLRRAIDGGEVLYFFLPSISQSVSVRAVAGLVLYTWQRVAEQRMREGLPKRNLWTYVDEWPEIAGRSMERFIFHTRKTGVNLTLINQNNSQLRNRDIDLHPVVFAASKLKLYFNFLGKEELDELMSLSQTTRKLLYSYSTSESAGLSLGQSSGQTDGSTVHEQLLFLGSVPDSHSKSRSITTGSSESQSTGSSKGVSATEHIMPALDVNDALDVDATSGRFYMMLRNGRGYAAPLAVDGQYSMPQALFEHFQSLPLPKRPEQLMEQVEGPPVSPPPRQAKSLIKKAAPAQKKQDVGRRTLLQDLWQRVESAIGPLTFTDDPEKTTDP